MSKGFLLVATIILLAVGVMFVPGQLYLCGWVFVLFGAIFGIAAFRKYKRDAALALEARTPRIPPAPIEPPVMTQGSSRLFIPPPLERK